MAALQVTTTVREARRVGVASCIHVSSHINTLLYTRPPPALNASSNDWLIWLQGGGLCVEMIDCLMRAKTPLGSSTHWASCHRKGDNATSMLGSNPDNPFASFNRIYIPYCSGDTWAGNSTAKNPRMGELYTSGHVVLDVILDHLSATAGLNAAKRVLLTGASAGGIGTFINADFVAQRLSNAVVKAAPQGGWYLPNLAELYYEWDLGIHVPIGLFFGTYVGAQFDCYLNQRCMADMRAAHKDPHVCWDVTVHYPYIETQLLVIENQFDAVRGVAKWLCLVCVWNRCTHTLCVRPTRTKSSTLC